MFDSWKVLYFTLINGTIGYLALILLLKISGKRTLAQLNAFDFIVTVAFGTILGSIFLSKDTYVVQGAFGFGLLLLLQYIITSLSVRSKQVQNALKTQPTLLLYRGDFQYHALKHERVTEDEVRAALRSKGIAALEDAEAVVLEKNGNFSVIEKNKSGSASALVDVKGYPKTVSVAESVR